MSSAAIYADAEVFERKARELLDTMDLASPLERQLEIEDRVEELREDARSIRTRVANSIEHIRNYYGLNLRVGLEVKHDGREGRIVGFAGQYVAVHRDGDEMYVICHATAGMEYPEGVQVGPGPDERFAHLVQAPATEN
ncbi:hypothetical protein HZZ00_37620 (plasmid) [Streptomyces sp. NEAU-sy36]|uniref:hypothetical protein n=1 Tax=unclassified Streptomyces TaxID=2593676 RepID=UPI0015D5A52E|nr:MULTISPECIES: hypothetical protein [unclassified Streptomyces]QLJ06753.1 hypothetical protein HZZ00_37620 [Streptomyces sp. NEAU-sy36]